MRALDSRTLEVQLEHPTPYFLDLCATPPLQPVPTRVIAKYGDDWVKPSRIVTNGAYTLADWRINDRIRLRKNPSYWDRAHVALETIDVLPIADPDAAFNFYASGEADLTADKGLVPIALIDNLRERPDYHAAAFLGTYFLRFNCKEGPFADPRVRLAFSLAVDKQRIVKKITRAGERPAGSLVPPGLPGYASPRGCLATPPRPAASSRKPGIPTGAASRS